MISLDKTETLFDEGKAWKNVKDIKITLKAFKEDYKKVTNRFVIVEELLKKHFGSLMEDSK